ncbi:MAG: hypothetical protein AAF789_10135 [Bacteroidota bacterium]
MKGDNFKLVKQKVLTKLKKTLEDDPDVFRYYNVFVSMLNDEREILLKSLEKEDALTLRSYAHKNKSSLLLGGLKELSLEAEDILRLFEEKATNSDIFTLAKQHLDHIDSALKELN